MAIHILSSIYLIGRLEVQNNAIIVRFIKLKAERWMQIDNYFS